VQRAQQMLSDSNNLPRPANFRPSTRIGLSFISLRPAMMSVFFACNTQALARLTDEQINDRQSLIAPLEFVFISLTRVTAASRSTIHFQLQTAAFKGVS